ncbi:hypothetical protein E1176_12030 [Fulvivirga sp. RKSG066]|uniref:hypothetical protein n=1 Tax=Fulvivirga aurantia TaxID=2529383 RepID=UPI0012BD80B9|nr:hypothetical protein [Fulvivirga aurantia]MTI21751.1 hypothetical protein [Fulvivirga aurantia]
MEKTANQRLYFDFGEVFQNTKSFIDRHNSRQTQLPQKLNANHRATAELIIRLYLKQLNKAAQLDQLDPENLPGFNTYNESLAKCKGCTKRTIINHRERLVNAGFIRKEQHCGQGGVEIWINPEVMGTVKLSTSYGDNVIKIGQLASLFLDKAKNFHPLVHEQHEQKNNNSKVDNVDNVIKGVPYGHESGKATGTSHEQDKNTEENANPASKRQEKAPEKLCEAEKQEQKPGAGRIFLLSLIRQFWAYARKVLYPDLVLSEPEEREILNLIWESVYGKLHWQASEKDWLNYQETAYNRVNMVARWLARSPGHWIPKPHIYFHPNNERNGFKKTWQWYVRQETLKIGIRNQLLLQQVKAEWQQHKQDKGRFQQKTRLQLFRIQQKRLANYRDESLMRAYQQCLQRCLHLEKLKCKQANHA